MGLVSYTGRAREGQTGCEATEWESETSMRCMVGHGARGTRRVAMTVGERGGSVSQALSMDLGSLSLLRRVNRAGTGSASVTVHGIGLGLSFFTTMIRFGQSICEVTEWESDSALRCLSGSAVRGSRRVAITSMLEVGSITHSFSLDLPTLTSFYMNPGGEFRSLEFPGKSTVDRAQRGLMLFFPDKSITIELWMRKDLVFPGVMQAVIGCKSDTGFFHELVLWSSDSALMLEVKNQLAQEAYCSLTPSVWAHYALTWDTVLGTVTCTKDGVLQNTQNDIAKGLLFDNKVAMMIGQDYGNTVTTENAFRGGISQLRIWNTVISNRVITYAKEKTYPQSAILRGDFINMIAYYKFPQYFTGTDSSGKNNHLAIVGRAETILPIPAPVSLAMAYSEKSLLSPPNRPATGANSVTVRGAAFGSEDYTGQSRGRHFSACEATEWKSETAIRVRIAAAVSASRTTMLTMGELANSITYAYTVDRSRVSSSRWANTASTGSHSVTVKGMGFGLRDHSGVLSIKFTAGETTKWMSDSTIRSLVTSSVGGTRRVTITAGTRTSTWSDVFSFDSRNGMHSAVARTNHPSTGSTSITLSGASYGLFQATVRPKIGHTLSEATTWCSTTGILVRAAYGFHGTRRVAVTTGMLPGTHTAAVSFDTGKINVHLSLELRNHAATGSILLTVMGSGFGQRLASARCNFLGTNGEATKWTSGKNVLILQHSISFLQLTLAFVLCRNINDTQNTAC